MFIAIKTVIATNVRRNISPLNRSQKVPLITLTLLLLWFKVSGGKRILFSLSICCSTSRSWLSAPAIRPFPANHRGDSIKYLPERNQANSMPIPPSRNIIRQLKKAITTTPIAADSMGDQFPTNESRADHFPRTVAGINSVNEA